MRTPLRTSVVLVMLCFGAGALQPAHAQFGRLKKKLKEKVDEKIEQREEQAAEAVVDEADARAERAVRDAFERAGEQAAAEQAAAFDLGPNATAPADAPAVRYRSVTSMDMGGLGAFARMAGQAPGSEAETVTVTTTYQRTDSEDGSFVLDAAGGRFFMLNHAQQTYAAMTFADMTQMAEAQMAQLEQQTGQASGAQTDAEVDLDFSVSTDRTGRREMVNGSDAEQQLLTIGVDVEATSAEDPSAQLKGSIYTLVDLWTTTDLAGYQTIQSMQQHAGEQMQDQLAGGGGLAAFGMMDARMGASLQKAMEEMQSVEGLPVRSTVYVVLVPEGQALDAEAAMAPAPEQKGLGGLMQMAEAASASGGAGPSAQMTLMSVTTQIADLEPIADPGPFTIPNGYREVPMQQLWAN